MASRGVARCVIPMGARVSGTECEHAILIALGSQIRSRRIEIGLSQEALANLAGIDRSHMGKIERGERNVTILNIERVAKVLECTPSSLLENGGF